MEINAKTLASIFYSNEVNQNLDQIANEFYLHQESEYYQEIASKVMSNMDIASAYRLEAMKLMDEGYKEVYADCAFNMGLDELTLLSPSPFTQNPYFKLLAKLNDKKVGKVTFFKREYLPYETFIYDEADESEDITHEEKLNLGFFDKPFSFPAIRKNGEVWMSLIPHEILTMEKAIARAKGNAITFGLGLGYFAFMASKKQEVNSLTIVELDPEVISLFKSTLLPLFPHKEKIILIQGDAIEFAKNEHKTYDSLFVDTYHNEVDGLNFALRLIPHLNHFGQVDFWIEKSILQFFRRYVIAILEESEFGYNDDDYKVRKDDYTALLGAIYDRLKNEKFDDSSLQQLLSLSGLKALLSSIRI